RTAPMELTISLQLSEFSAELPNFSINEMVPLAIESSIIAPSQVALESPQSVPEPSSVLLLGAAISLFALISIARYSFTLTQIALTHNQSRLIFRSRRSAPLKGTLTNNAKIKHFLSWYLFQFECIRCVTGRALAKP